MYNTLPRSHPTHEDPLDITPFELVHLLDAGLDSTEIDRLRFSRWRLRTHRLEGDGWPTSRRRVSDTSTRDRRWIGHREPRWPD